jgi:hypothetical protein
LTTLIESVAAGTVSAVSAIVARMMDKRKFMAWIIEKQRGAPRCHIDY